MVEKIARSDPRVSCSSVDKVFFDLFITKSQLDYAICFVQSGNTSATHGNALPFPRFLRPRYKAADEISSKEFNGEFRSCREKCKSAKMGKKRKREGEMVSLEGKRKTGEIV